MRETAPLTREGQMAWSLGQIDTLWVWLPIFAAGGGSLILQGLDHDKALSLAQARAADLNMPFLSLALTGLEQGRRKGERAMRDTRGS